MGKPTLSSSDIAGNVASGTLSGTQDSTATPFVPISKNWAIQPCKFNFSLAFSSGAVGTARISESFDGGVTWLPLCSSGTSSALSFTGSCVAVLEEVEAGVMYSVVVSMTTGSVTYRFSQGFANA